LILVNIIENLFLFPFVEDRCVCPFRRMFSGQTLVWTHMALVDIGVITI